MLEFIEILLFSPPGSFCVARDLHRIVISAVTIEPGATTFVPRPSSRLRYYHSSSEVFPTIEMCIRL